MVKNIIFDIGNVLSDFRWYEFLLDKGFDEAMVQRIANASVRTPHWNELDRGVISHDELIEGFVRQDPGIEKELWQAFADMHGIVTVRDYAVPWIQDLKRRGYRVYYLSNFSRKAELECGEVLAFTEYTDGGILSYREHLVKPDPAIYELLLNRYGLVAEESVFVDDLPDNVEAAGKLGIHGIVFTSREQVEEELAQL